MANVICGGMKTLGVVLDTPGKTNQILADTDKQVCDKKLQFATENPIIKFDAPTLTEISDLPIYPFPHGNINQKNKWVVDCVLDWNGKFDDSAKNTSSSFQMISMEILSGVTSGTAVTMTT